MSMRITARILEEMNLTEVYMGDVEKALILFNERVTEAVFQRYTDGLLSQEELLTTNKLLSEWFNTATILLKEYS
jgi:hypothetical protein